MALMTGWGIRACTCALALAAGTFVSPAALAGRTAESVMNEAVKAREAGDLERVVALLREAYQLHPAPAILNNLGKILEQMGRYREAVDAYQRVADDPKADAQLRTLDTSRIAALRPKMNKAWVLPQVDPPDALIYMDGAFVDLPPGVEFPASHRRHVILVVHPDGEQAVVRVLKFPVERRTVFTLQMGTPHPTDGVLEIPAEAGLRSLSLDGRALGPVVRKLRSVRLPAGTYELEVTDQGGASGTTSLTIEAGSTTRLADILASAGSGDGAKSGRPRGFPKVDAGLSAGSERSTLRIVLPWAGVAAGLGTAILGGVLYGQALDAETDLETALSQGDGKYWTLDGEAASFSVISYDEAADREAQIGSDKTMATVVMGVGAVLTLGSLAWQLLSGDGGTTDASGGDGAASAQVFMGPLGLGVRGSF
jgi:hypothetical protein